MQVGQKSAGRSLDRRTHDLSAARGPSSLREQSSHLQHPTLNPQPISAGLYVHFPYCVTICHYCDFDRQAHGFELVPRYLEALAAEIAQQPTARLHSVFFGGGTPSLMKPAQVAGVLEAVGRRFQLAPEAEITLEANPDDLSVEKVRGFRAAGVNRLSIGVQTFDDATLRLLGRRHDAARAEAAVRAARDGGVENLSLDLMYGLPAAPRLGKMERGSDGERGPNGDTPARPDRKSGGPQGDDGLRRWRRTLERALALEPDHLSCYLLTLEPEVPMGRWVEQGRLALPTDEQVARQYELARRLLAEAGMQQYEISNWARPGRASRHNLTYWRDEPYLGVGAGAASSWQGRRYKNAPHVKTYIETALTGEPARAEWEETPLTAQIEDYLALTLRLREGLEPSAFARRFGRDLADALGEELSTLLASGHLEWHDGRLRVTEDSLLVTNEILARLVRAAGC